MTITTSRCGTVIDALVTRCQASPTFADPARVYDGPVTTGDTEWTQAVYIGFDGNWQGSFESALIDQELAYVGNTTMRETLDIRCVAEAWSGDPTVQAIRAQALTMLAGVETVLRTDPTLGIDGSTIATLQVGALYQAPFKDGLAVRIPFVVHVITTITTITTI